MAATATTATLATSIGKTTSQIKSGGVLFCAVRGHCSYGATSCGLVLSKLGYCTSFAKDATCKFGDRCYKSHRKPIIDQEGAMFKAALRVVMHLKAKSNVKWSMDYTALINYRKKNGHCPALRPGRGWYLAPLVRLLRPLSLFLCVRVRACVCVRACACARACARVCGNSCYLDVSDYSAVLWPHHKAHRQLRVAKVHRARRRTAGFFMWTRKRSRLKKTAGINEQLTLKRNCREPAVNFFPSF